MIKGTTAYKPFTEEETVETVEESKVEVMKDFSKYEPEEVAYEHLSAEDESEMDRIRAVRDEFNKMEGGFNEIIDSLKSATDRASDNIKMEEINEIGTYIKQATLTLNDFASGKDMNLKEKVLDTFSFLPGFKKKLQEAQNERFNSTSVKDVIDSIFEGFGEKNNRLIEMSEILADMDLSLKSHNKKLTEYVEEISNVAETTTDPYIGNKAIRMGSLAMAHLKMSDEMIGQINGIMRAMGGLLDKINTSIPAIEGLLKNQINIAAAVNSVNETLNMMKDLEGLTNEITSKSTKNIQDMTIQVIENSGTGLDIKYIQDSAKNNADFQKRLTEKTLEAGKQRQKEYKILKEVHMNSNTLIEDRAKQEAALIEDFTKSFKKDK